MISIRKQIRPEAFDWDEGWGISLLFNLAVTEELHVSHLRHSIARDVYKPVKALAAAESSEDVAVEASARWVYYSHNLTLRI